MAGERISSLTDGELERLLEPPELAGAAGAMRAQLACRLLAVHGLRADIAVSLKLSDYRPGQGLRVGRSLVSIDEQTTALVERIVGSLSAQPHLLATRSELLSRRGLARLLERYGKTRGVTAVTTERLRRTYARRLYEAGASDVELLELLELRDRGHLRSYLRADPNCASPPGTRRPARAASRSRAGAVPAAEPLSEIAADEQPRLFPDTPAE